MAYTDATANDLQAAFPAFAAVADETVEFWLTRARRSVDQSWTEDDYAMGQMLKAADLMVQAGLGTGVASEAAAAGMAGFKRLKSASLEIERGDSGSGDGSAAYASIYGKQFADLARLNVGGPRVMPTGTAPYDPYRYPQGEE